MLGSNMWSLEPEFVTEKCDLSIEAATTTNIARVSTDIGILFEKYQTQYESLGFYIDIE